MLRRLHLHTCYLFEGRWGYRKRFLPLKLLHLVENYSSDIEIEPHANSIGGNKNIKAAVGVIEKGGLVAPHFRGKGAIDYAALEVRSPLDHCLDVEYIASREGYDRVSGLNAAVAVWQGLGLDFQLSESVVVADCQSFPHTFAHLLDERKR